MIATAGVIAAVPAQAAGHAPSLVTPKKLGLKGPYKVLTNVNGVSKQCLLATSCVLKQWGGGPVVSGDVTISLTESIAALPSKAKARAAANQVLSGVPYSSKFAWSKTVKGCSSRQVKSTFSDGSGGNLKLVSTMAQCGKRISFVQVGGVAALLPKKPTAKVQRALAVKLADPKRGPLAVGAMPPPPTGVGA